jgi:hypothetical protein
MNPTTQHADGVPIAARDQPWLPQAAAVRPTKAKAFASRRWPPNRGG